LRNEARLDCISFSVLDNVVPFEIQLTESLFVAAADSYVTADLIPSSVAAGEDGDWYLPTSVWMTKVGHCPVQPAAGGNSSTLSSDHEIDQGRSPAATPHTQVCLYPCMVYEASLFLAKDRYEA
jgi:hypothetical protein